MKIRTGFVANSSSSSFIIGLAKVPEGTINSKKIILTEDGKLNHDVFQEIFRFFIGNRIKSCFFLLPK